MREVYKAIGRVADQKVIVLITGESGTGKELVARAIYQHSDRARALFLAINCAAIPESLLESEMFGHEKGAFTGADRRASESSSSATAARCFWTRSATCRWRRRERSCGCSSTRSSSGSAGNDTIQTDVRLIAATNRDLKA
jgi:two-component system nitrogen regulation response regulator GlnG